MQETSFYFFLNTFGSAICGYDKFCDSMKQQMLFSEVCTVSDEAFGILVLKKNWNTWLQYMSGNVSSENREILMFHSAVCEEYATNKTNKKFSGWNVEALKEFTSIALDVKRSRNTPSRKELELKYKNSKSTIIKFIDNGDDSLNRVESIVPYNELSDFSQEESDVTHMSSQESDFEINPGFTENVELSSSRQGSIHLAQV